VSSTLRLAKFCFEIGHVPIEIAQASGLAQPDAVDDARMVELVGDHSILRAQESLEEATVRVEAGGVQDRILGTEELGEPALQLLVNLGSAADEAYGCHAEPPALQRLLGGRDHDRVIGQTEVIIGTEVEQLLTSDRSGPTVAN
jgi:hypothetical protein